MVNRICVIYIYVTIPTPTKFNGKFQRTRAKPIKAQARSERGKGKGKNGTFYFHSKDLDSFLFNFFKGDTRCSVGGEWISPGEVNMLQVYPFKYTDRHVLRSVARQRLRMSNANWSSP